MSNLAEDLSLCTDRREYPRIPVMLAGQMLISTGMAKEVQITNMSAGGAGVRYLGRPPGADLTGTLTVEGFGNIPGVTTRDTGKLCGLRFLIGEAERRHLQARLAGLIRSGLPGLVVQPENDQWAEDSRLVLTRFSGKQHECEVVEISLLGVALHTSFPVPEGEHVLVGKMFGRVLKVEDGRLTVQFLRYGTT